MSAQADEDIIMEDLEDAILGGIAPEDQHSYKACAGRVDVCNLDHVWQLAPALTLVGVIFQVRPFGVLIDVH
jgi:hypothetical protein